MIHVTMAALGFCLLNKTSHLEEGLELGGLQFENDLIRQMQRHDWLLIVMDSYCFIGLKTFTICEYP